MSQDTVWIGKSRAEKTKNRQKTALMPYHQNQTLEKLHGRILWMMASNKPKRKRLWLAATGKITGWNAGRIANSEPIRQEDIAPDKVIWLSLVSFKRHDDLEEGPAISKRNRKVEDIQKANHKFSLIGFVGCGDTGGIALSENSDPRMMGKWTTAGNQQSYDKVECFQRLRSAFDQRSLIPLENFGWVKPDCSQFWFAVLFQIEQIETKNFVGLWDIHPMASLFDPGTHLNWSDSRCWTP
jgi:hypothetical protein